MLYSCTHTATVVVKGLAAAVPHHTTDSCYRQTVWRKTQGKPRNNSMGRVYTVKVELVEEI